jgi:HEAT repeat protein
VEELFQRLAGIPVTSATAEALGRTLEASGDPEIYATAEAGYWSGPPELRDALLPYLLHAGAGREAGIGKVVREGSVEHARAALLWLTEHGTAAAREALHQAFQSPHVEVRVAAITHLPEASSETVRAELTKLFDDPAPEVRQKALAVVGSLRAVAAGPILVRRIQSGALDALPLSERRLLLRTLADLNPRRAEDIAIELLGKTQLVPTPSAEETRVAAAEVLGEMSSDEALAALEGAAKRRWWNTAPVRAAAEQATAAVLARRGAGGAKEAR